MLLLTLHCCCCPARLLPSADQGRPQRRGRRRASRSLRLRQRVREEGAPQPVRRGHRSVQGQGGAAWMPRPGAPSRRRVFRVRLRLPRQQGNTAAAFSLSFRLRRMTRSSSLLLRCRPPPPPPCAGLSQLQFVLLVKEELERCGVDCVKRSPKLVSQFLNRIFGAQRSARSLAMAPPPRGVTATRTLRPFFASVVGRPRALPSATLTRGKRNREGSCCLSSVPSLLRSADGLPCVASSSSSFSAAAAAAFCPRPPPAPAGGGLRLVQSGVRRRRARGEGGGALRPRPAGAQRRQQQCLSLIRTNAVPPASGGSARQASGRLSLFAPPAWLSRSPRNESPSRACLRLPAQELGTHAPHVTVLREEVIVRDVKTGAEGQLLTLRVSSAAAHCPHPLLRDFAAAHGGGAWLDAVAGRRVEWCSHNASQDDY